MPTNKDVQLKTIVDFARRKGIVYPSSEIYGGFAATYDFGPLGKLLKDNLVNAWRDWMVNYRTDTVEIEGAIFLHPKVWTASGHVGGFSDLLVEDLVTHKRYRADHLVEEAGVNYLDKQNNPTLSEADTDKILPKPVADGANIVVKLSHSKKIYFYVAKANSEEVLSCGFNPIYISRDTVGTRELYSMVNRPIENQLYLSLTYDPKDYKHFSLYLNTKKTRIIGETDDALLVYSEFDDEQLKLNQDKFPAYFIDHGNDNHLNFVHKSVYKSRLSELDKDVECLFEKIDDTAKDLYLITDAGSLSAEEIDQIIEHYKIKSPEGNPLSKARKFNLLVKTHLGPVEDDSSLAYLKGEACQNIYVDWKAVQETTRRKIPFGIAQMGKAFRNEINVKQYLFRTREFEQIDMQYFVKPPEYIKKDEAGNKLEKDHLDWFAYWKDQRYKFYTEFLGYNPENLKWHQHTPEELVFYCVEAWDVYYNFGALGYKEMEGAHNRTDYDTRQHQQYSGADLTYLDPETNQRYLPYVVEMSLGVNRLFLSCLFEFYKEEVIQGETTPSAITATTSQVKGNEETRIVFKLPYKLAPYKIAILPLMKKDGMKEKAEEIYLSLKKQGISCDYDDAGSIGKRYRRQDENGTPWCMCIDYETIKEGELQDTVTLRNRDTMEQIRVKVSEIDNRFLSEKL